MKGTAIPKFNITFKLKKKITNQQKFLRKYTDFDTSSIFAKQI